MPTTTTRADAGYVYVYAAAEPDPALALDAQAMPGAAAPEALALDDGVSLVVSRVPAELYNAAAIESRLSDLDWVSSAGAAHHAVVDALSAAGVLVVPFRLFTVFSSAASALHDLGLRLPAIRRAFERVRGRDEWILRIGVSDPARRDPTPAAPAATSGTGFLAAKADARRAERDRAERMRQDAAAAFAALQAIADAATTRPVDPAGKLLLDAALLVPPGRIDEMKTTLTGVAKRLLRDGCPVSLTGPWPPYSFASLDPDTNG